MLQRASAEERRRRRRELLQTTEEELDKVVEATRRAREPLRSKDKIGLRAGKVLGRFKMRKQLLISITDDGLSYQRNEDKIAEEAALDGFCVICQVKSRGRTVSKEEHGREAEAEDQGDGRLEGLPVFRNVLLHEYVSLDYDRVIEALAELEPIEQLARFVAGVEAEAPES